MKLSARHYIYCVISLAMASMLLFHNARPTDITLKEIDQPLWLLDGIYPCIDSANGRAFAYRAKEDTSGAGYELAYQGADSSWLFETITRGDSWDVYHYDDHRTLQIFDDIFIAGTGLPDSSIDRANVFGHGVIESGAVTPDCIQPRHVDTDSTYNIAIGATGSIHNSALASTVHLDAEWITFFDATFGDSLASGNFGATFDNLSTTTYTMPGADGSADDVIVTDGSGVLSWEAQAGAAGGDAWSDAVDSDILPTGADDTYDIGSGAAQFKDGYFDGTLEGDILTEGGENVWNDTETDIIKNTHIDWADVTAIYLPVDTLTAATHDNLQAYIDVTGSASIVEGGAITDNEDGTINVATGEAMLRTTDSEIGRLVPYSFDPKGDLALTDNNTNWIYLQYNGGSPQILATATLGDIDFHTEAIIGRVYRNGTELHITMSGMQFPDYALKMSRRLWEVYGTDHADGMATAHTGTRQYTVSAGVFYIGHNRLLTDAQNTSGGDTFTSWHNDGAWQSSPGQTAIDSVRYNDYGTGLADLTANRYCAHWLYIHEDNDMHIVYGIGDYFLAQAEAAQVPANMPAEVTSMGILIARIIIKKSASSFTQIDAPWEGDITMGTVTDHGSLAGLDDPDHDAVYVRLTAVGDSVEANAYYPGGTDVAETDIVAAMTRDTEWNTTTKINTAMSDGNFLIEKEAYKEVFFPEYSNALLDTLLIHATSNKGNFATGEDSIDASNQYQYYKWTAHDDSTADQYYSVRLKWLVPLDWTAFDNTAALKLYYKTGIGATADNSVTVDVYENGTLEYDGEEVANASWDTITLTDTTIGGGSWAAGDVLRVRMVVKANNTADAEAFLGRLELIYAK